MRRGEFDGMYCWLSQSSSQCEWCCCCLKIIAAEDRYCSLTLLRESSFHFFALLPPHQGDCCPTNDGFGFLACCAAVSDECLDGNCTFTETSDYLEFMAADQGSLSSVRDVSKASWSSMAVASMGVIVLTVQGMLFV